MSRLLRLGVAILTVLAVIDVWRWLRGEQTASAELGDPFVAIGDGNVGST